MKFMHIGDVLLTTPLLKNLRYHFPSARIDFALNKGTEEMITENPSVGKIHIYDRQKIKKLPLPQRLKEEAKFAIKLRKENYDIVINLTRGDRGLFLATFSGSNLVISHPSNKNHFFNRFIHRKLPDIQRKHWVDINLDALRVLGKNPVEKRVRIYWNEQIERNIENILKTEKIKNRQFIHFHPVSRWLFKCLDDKLAANIIDYCQKNLRLPVVITAAPVQEEMEKIGNILSYCETGPINLAGKLSLKETAALNKRSRLYIGVDTAIMHISAANEIPTLAFFGPSIPYAWAPWDNDYMENGYICYRGNQRMGKHRILQKRWECVPCDSKGCNNSGISDCLMQMDLDEVKRAIKEMAERTAS